MVVNTFSHTGSGLDEDLTGKFLDKNSTPAERASYNGYTSGYVGENIAYGYPDLESVMAGWAKSAGHCRNMMNANYTDIGFAREADYWTQDFGGK